MNIESLAIVIAAFAAGAFAKGLTGIGLPTIAIPFLAGVIGAEQAVVTMAIPAFVSNIWICWGYRRMAPHVPKLGIALAFAAIGTMLGVYILSTLSNDVLIYLIIGWIALYLVNLLLNPDFRIQGRAATVASPLLALLAGISQGATGISGPVVATWIHSYRLEKEGYVFGVCVMFLCVSGVQTLSVAAGGLMDIERMLTGLLAVIPTLLFVPLGMRALKHVSPVAFNRIIIVCIVVLEARLIWKQFVTA
ncbi:MAG TPA: sulfite exporter TauE/SafE family protein [Acetobacteraceae bacterium]|nr:sulfite exporter TauE/SafE family protein [Acetobacteraceae bacterium]